MVTYILRAGASTVSVDVKAHSNTCRHQLQSCLQRYTYSGIWNNVSCIWHISSNPVKSCSTPRINLAMSFPPFPAICLGESSSLACYLSFAGVKRNQITSKHTNIKYASTSTQTLTKAQWSQTEYKVISTHWSLGTRSFWKCHFEPYFYGWRQEPHNWTCIGICYWGFYLR